MVDAALIVIAEAASQAGHVRAIGIASQGEAFTPVDENGAILAGQGIGLFDLKDASLSYARPIRTFEPNAENREP